MVPPGELLEQATQEERVSGGRGTKRQREVTPDSNLSPSGPVTAVDDNDVIIDLTQE